MKNDLMLGISGSLNNGSLCGGVLDSLESIARGKVGFFYFVSLKCLPPFDPQVKSESKKVISFKAKIANLLQWLLRHQNMNGMHSVLKNALDWTVFLVKIYQKPVTVVSVSSMESGVDRTLLLLLVEFKCFRNKYSQKPYT